MALPRRQLVILQQSPFCNIDCKYCYLPHRSRKDRMSVETLTHVYNAVFQSEKIRDPITFLWHAGEPLAAGYEFFERAFELGRNVNRQYGREYTHNIQTNATLINERWVDLFSAHNVLMGVSLDGPAFIHNSQRVTRSGKGTYAQVMNGIEHLQRRGINFEVICVLTSSSLDFPDEMFDFFVEKGIKGIGFNIDEIEGTNQTSTFQNSNSEVKYRRFIRRFLERCTLAPGLISVREFRSIIPVILYPNVSLGEGEGFNNTNVPLQILTINYRGDYSTFCPELAGTSSATYQDFSMGNVYTHPIDAIYEHPIFQQVNEGIQSGVKKCKASCEYWSFCGGGSPANKFFETGRFDVAETMHCRIHVKALADTIIEFFEEHLVKLETGEIHERTY